MVTMYRQGDILFLMINDIPTRRRRKIKTDVIVRGEATNHAHRIVNGTLINAANEEGIYRVYIKARKGTKIVHDEHGEIELPPGNYLVVRQREYDPDFPLGQGVWVLD